MTPTWSGERTIIRLITRFPYIDALLRRIEVHLSCMKPTWHDRPVKDPGIVGGHDLHPACPDCIGGRTAAYHPKRIPCVASATSQRSRGFQPTE